MPQPRSLALAATVVASLAAALTPDTTLAFGRLLSVGAVTRHADHYVGHQVTISGFVLAQEKGYALISDEPSGRIGHFDLPVVGMDVSSVKGTERYVFEGTLLGAGLEAVNGDPIHLELTALPVPSKH